jgi:AraC-like DNA-binding protein
MTAGTINVAFRTNRSPVVTNTVSAGMAIGLVEFAVARGANRADLISEAGIDADSLTSEDRRLPFSQYAALYAAAETLCDDRAFALHFGEDVSAMDSLLVCHVGSASDTMGGALAMINHYGRLSVDLATANGGDPFQVERGPEGNWLIDATVYPAGVPQVTETSLARLIVGTRQLSDRNFVRAVHLVRGAPAFTAEYERIFRTPAMFEQQRNAMLLDPEWFSLPLNAASRCTAPILEAHANKLLEELTPVRRWCRRAVEEIVQSELASAAVSMDHVAARLGISRQTLYRQLKLEGTTFEEVLNRVRRDAACNLLREGASVPDIALRLGFSDRSAFSRAYKRWTGRSPRSN